MIIFEDNLTKYINDKDWYDLKFLNYNLKGWNRHLQLYEKKIYKTPAKNAEKDKQIRLSKDQINKINLIMDLL